MWTPLFFGLHKKSLALVDILALTGTSAWWTKSLFEIGPVRIPGVGDLNPGWLAVPYLGWLSYGESGLGLVDCRVSRAEHGGRSFCSYLLELGIPRLEPGRHQAQEVLDT